MCTFWMIFALFNWAMCGFVALWIGKAGGHFIKAPKLAPIVVFLFAPVIVFWSVFVTRRPKKPQQESETHG